jgi:hypothetical protein
MIAVLKKLYANKQGVGEVALTEAISLVCKLYQSLQNVRHNHRALDDNGLPLFYDLLNQAEIPLRKQVDLIRTANFRGAYTRELEALDEVQSIIRSSRNGVNRTKPGETVTPQDVFLGNIYGLFTLPVPRWRECEDEKPGMFAFRSLSNLNTYQVVERQAHEIMDGYLYGLKGLASALKG